MIWNMGMLQLVFKNIYIKMQIKEKDDQIHQTKIK